MVLAGKQPWETRQLVVQNWIPEMCHVSKNSNFVEILLINGVQSKQKRHEVNLKRHSLRFPQWDQNDTSSRYSSQVGNFYTFRDWYSPFCRCACSRATVILCVCRLNPASSVNTQFRVKSKSGMDSHSTTFSFLSSSTRSLFLVAGNFGALSVLRIDFCIQCPSKADMEIDSPGIASHTLCLTSGSIAAGFSILTSINPPKNWEWISLTLL
jgi:hypothetical protein